jgi:sec-independent protein translocase protein TatB
VFDNLNWWEIVALLLLALFIFGPERLPKVIGDGLRMLRNLRDMARNATSDLSRELGTDVRLEDLHPKTFVRRHLLSEDEEAELRRPFDDAYRDVRQISTDVNDYRSGRPAGDLPPPRAANGGYDSPPANGSQGYDPPAQGYGSTPGYEPRPYGSQSDHDAPPRHDQQGDYKPQHGYDRDAT